MQNVVIVCGDARIIISGETDGLSLAIQAPCKPFERLSMQIVACIKQVPDTTQVQIDPVTNTLIREGIPFIMNPYDTHALEEALRFKDRFGFTVTAISMGPPNAEATLKKALALGGDHAILLSDRVFGGADTLATSSVLAAAIRKL